MVISSAHDMEIWKMTRIASRSMTSAAIVTSFLALMLVFVPTREANAGDFGLALNLGNFSLGLGVGNAQPVPAPAPAPEPEPAPRPVYRGQAPLPPCSGSHYFRPAPKPMRGPAPYHSFAPSGPSRGPYPTQRPSYRAPNYRPAPGPRF